MNNVNLFLNAEIKDCGRLAAAADLALSPVRYFFHGHTVKVVKFQAQDYVQHVSSFKDKGDTANVVYNTDDKIHTKIFVDGSSRGYLKSVAIIALFVPGLILGTIAKSFAYLSDDMRAKHRLAKLHFTLVDKTIGSEENRLDERGIQAELTKLKDAPLHQKVNNLIIYGNGNVEFKADPGFVAMNPKKVVLVGARIIRDSLVTTQLDDTLAAKKEWFSRSVLGDTDPTLVRQINIASVKEALDHIPPRRPCSSKTYHTVYLAGK